MKNTRPPSIFRSQDGASAIEFALIAPVLLLFTIAVIEISLMMLSQNVMESATFAASRLGKTGYNDTGKTRAETIREMLDDTASGLLDTSRVSIESFAYDDFGDVDKHEPFVDANANGVRDSGENYTDTNGNGKYDGAVAGYGTSGNVVVYVVKYPWHITTPIMSAIIGEDGVFNLTARTVVKNEPW